MAERVSLAFALALQPRAASRLESGLCAGAAGFEVLRGPMSIALMVRGFEADAGDAVLAQHGLEGAVDPVDASPTGALFWVSERERERERRQRAARVRV